MKANAIAMGLLWGMGIFVACLFLFGKDVPAAIGAGLFWGIWTYVRESREYKNSAIKRMRAHLQQRYDPAARDNTIRYEGSCVNRNEFIDGETKYYSGLNKRDIRDTLAAFEKDKKLKDKWPDFWLVEVNVLNSILNPSDESEEEWYDDDFDEEITPDVVTDTKTTNRSANVSVKTMSPYEYDGIRLKRTSYSKENGDKSSSATHVGQQRRDVGQSTTRVNQSTEHNEKQIESRPVKYNQRGYLIGLLIMALVIAGIIGFNVIATRNKTNSVQESATVSTSESAEAQQVQTESETDTDNYWYKRGYNVGYDDGLEAKTTGESRYDPYGSMAGEGSEQDDLYQEGYSDGYKEGYLMEDTATTVDAAENEAIATTEAQQQNGDPEIDTDNYWYKRGYNVGYDDGREAGATGESKYDANGSMTEEGADAETLYRAGYSAGYKEGYLKVMY